MDKRKAEKDLRKIMSMDYSNIKIVDTFQEMMDSCLISHSKVIDNRMKMALKSILSKEDFAKANQLIKAQNKQVFGLFLMERKIQMKVKQVASDTNPFQNFLYLDMIFEPTADVKKQVRLSYISEEEFRKQLKELKSAKEELNG